MKKIYIPLLFALLFGITINAQTVKTVVPGISIFNDGLAIDKKGNIYASMYYGSTVAKITPQGVVTTFASGFSSPNGIKFGPDDYLYVPSAKGNKIDRVSSSGEVSNFISIAKPSELYFDKEGLLYVTNYEDNIISLIDKDKKITQLFSGGKLDGPIGFLKDQSGTIYIGNFNDGKIFKVTNGTTFTEIGDLPGWLGFMILIDNNIYATAYQDQRIYKIPTDGSGQKVFAGSGLKGKADGAALQASFTNPNGIAATATGDTLYISDYGTRSLRMITGVRQTTSINYNSEIPNGFNLEQNYPNPFNPSTKIKYQLPKSSFVTLQVYNMLGQSIATLVNDYQNQGEYEINFDASSLASGVYIYALKTNNLMLKQKMLLAK